MKIVAIEPVRLEYPLRAPSSPARRPSYNKTAWRAFPIHKYPEFPRTIHQIPGEVGDELWVRVTAEDGTWGIGNCHWARYTRPLVETHYAPLLTGRDCFATELLNDLMWRSTQRYGVSGLVSVARSAVDLALWDLKGKLLRQPVWRLIGGACRDAARTYATSDDLDWSMELGFTAFKISNPVHHEEGTAGLNRLEDKVGQARDTVGRDADLMLNAVMSWNVEYAARVMDRLRPYHLRWIEEPLMPHDTAGLAQLKRAVPTLPIATGEDLHGRHEFLPLVEQRSVDVLQPDLRWCGGFTEALKIYAIGEAAGIVTVPHSSARTAPGQHFAYALPESPIAEYWMASDPGVPLADVPAVPGTPAPKDGRVVPSAEPGFGYTLRDDQVIPLK